MKTYQLNYADGYYIEKDSEGYLDFAEEVTGEEAQVVCDLLNNSADQATTIAEMREALELIATDLEMLLNGIADDSEENTRATLNTARAVLVKHEVKK